MIAVKLIIFILTVVTVRYIFIYINDIGDKRVIRMKELIDFTDYLRIYSCDMKMNFEEILMKYNFKNIEIEIICKEMLKQLKIINNECKISKDLCSFIEDIIFTPDEFNISFAEILNYYGCSYSDVLEKKLIFTFNEMQKIMVEYDNEQRERKNLYNRLSILVGCLAAVILI